MTTDAAEACVRACARAGRRQVYREENNVAYTIVDLLARLIACLPRVYDRCTACEGKGTNEALTKTTSKS